MTPKEEDRLNQLKSYENHLYEEGYKLICGVDEAGRGPLAGPVAVGCCVMKPESKLQYVNDSKKVTEKRREMLYDQIIEDSLAYSVAIISNTVIDEINILEATKKGVHEALGKVIEQLTNKFGKTTKPEIILVDALKDLDTYGVNYQSIIKGDATCYSISCASILAKVTRDRLMREYNEKYPEYGFEGHKGYGTAKHIEAIKKYGPCEIHRRSFISHFI